MCCQEVLGTVKLVPTVILAKYTSDVESRIVTAKTTLDKQETVFRPQTGLQFKKETNEVLHLGHRFTWRWKLGTSNTRSKNTWKVSKCGCWSRTEKIVWTDRVRNGEVQGVAKKPDSFSAAPCIIDRSRLFGLTKIVFVFC